MVPVIFESENDMTGGLKNFADWFKDTDEATPYRNAMDLADKMPLQVRDAVKGQINNSAYQRWRNYLTRNRKGVL
jgi:hypothetical protein